MKNLKSMLHELPLLLVIVFFADFPVIVISTIIQRRERCVSWPLRGTAKLTPIPHSLLEGVPLYWVREGGLCWLRIFNHLAYSSSSSCCFLVNSSIGSACPLAPLEVVPLEGRLASPVWGPSSQIVKWRIKTCHFYALIPFRFWKEKIKEICPALIFGHVAVIMKSVGLRFFSLLLG